ncbi:MAG: hypothetical protein JWO62_2946 [Acidimicrobiaceae bacterium]|jgi:hypothetical protein|nr:hypothetical protein [Acidimicrobiaceae bacterium]
MGSMVQHVACPMPLPCSGFDRFCPSGAGGSLAQESGPVVLAPRFCPAMGPSQGKGTDSGYTAIVPLSSNSQASSKTCHPRRRMAYGTGHVGEVRLDRSPTATEKR